MLEELKEDLKIAEEVINEENTVTPMTTEGEETTVHLTTNEQ